MRYTSTILAILTINTCQLSGQHLEQHSTIDVLSYEADLEPNISQKSIQGSVIITFDIVNTGNVIVLDCGDLVIDDVSSNDKVIPFENTNNKLSIDASGFGPEKKSHKIRVRYHGSPRRGISFYPQLEQVYTVFSTSHWLPCKDNPDDKATLTLKITASSHLKIEGSGELVGTSATENRTTTEWNQSTAFSTYTFGFAAGPFNLVEQQNVKVKLRYLSSSYSENELNMIFEETGNMIKFFEEKSGVPYPGKTYSQILAEGNVSQEMAGLAVIRLNYGKQVLTNSMDINLGAHELAHQWWGNSITCESWNDFWLNEGFAVYMSSAFREARFGREQYAKDIEIYRNAYDAVVKKGLDKALVFDKWISPTSDDRTLVYYKGAYVLHLLREHLGDKAFWEGVRQYTISHVGRSVVSTDLQHSMEKASGKDLNNFFSRWVYL